MILAAGGILLTLVISALAIDTATWYQKRHQTQVAADAASLAAANCLANSGSGKTCTSTTDTTHAASVATQIAAANGLTIPTSEISFSSGKVTVTIPTTAPGLFARAASVGTATVSASAIASYTTASTSSTCTTSSCYAIFAADTSCSGTDIYLQDSGMTVNGVIRSNGSFGISSHKSTYASATYACGLSDTSGQDNTFGTSATEPTQLSGTLPWPQDFTSAFPLTGGQLTAANDPNCTQTGSDLNLQNGGATLANNNSYCYQTIEFNEGSLTCLQCTFVASQSITFNNGSGDTFTPRYQGTLLFYDMASGGVNINANGFGFLNSSATSFFPNASVAVNSPSGNLSGFIEAQDVTVNSGSGSAVWQGTGPQVGGSGSTTGADSLVQ